MASLLAFWGCNLTIILVITIVTPAAVAVEEFKVGDAEGWHQPGLNQTEMYDQWTSAKIIHVGDSLRFEYKNDSVLIVDKWGYYHCNATNSTIVYNDGNTTITLDKPGPIYFISGDADHCKDGQKLLIDVIPLHPISESPPPPYFGVSPGLSPSPSPFSSSGASVSSVKMVSVMVALFAALLAF